MQRLALALGLSILGLGFGCATPPQTDGRPPPGEANAGCCANKYDLLFVIDDSPSMAALGPKLFAQLPSFMSVLQNLPDPPSLHVAVVSSDLGAPSDAPEQIGCRPAGDRGAFLAQPQGACTETTLAPGATFIIDDPTANTTNFGLPEPAGLPAVFQCIGALGASGCSFQQPLAAIDRALGADGLGPPPPGNEGFLRPDADLAIVIISNQDDCSAPAGTTIDSLNGHRDDLSNPDGPLTHYRCNGGPRGAHLCQDPAGGQPTLTVPPLLPPSDATGDPPVLKLANCEDNGRAPPFGSGNSALTPVDKIVADIKALKPDPDNQIEVGGLIGPPAPYAVEWDPPPADRNVAPGELWPAVQHSCGPQGATDPMVNADAQQRTTDGSFGDPGVREAQFVNAFSNSVLASVCDRSYAQVLTGVAARLAALGRE